MELTDLHVGKQLQVVANLPGGIPGLPNVAHGAGAVAIPGTIWADGGLHVGAPLFAPGETEVGFCRPPATNALAFAGSLKSIFAISGRGGTNGVTDVVVGDPIGPVGISVNATLINIIAPLTNGVGVLNWIGTKAFIGVKAQTGVEVRAGAVADVGNESTIGAVVESGARVINGALIVNGATHINGFLSFISSIVGTTKQFDIKHPNKENHRLRHICLEGPEAGVYIRGRLTDSNIINLPEYWKGLIDPESITISLTQIGSSQDLIVDTIEWGSRIKIRSGNASKIDCYYVIHASRIDGEPLIIEYEGKTPEEYPGSKDQFSISGFDY